MKKRIYIREWAMMKPTNCASGTDTYYLGIANEIFSLFKKKQGLVLQMFLEEAEVRWLAVFIASYFEDVISQTDIWTAFTKKHMELYGKRLPFFNLEDYYPGEINQQDILFLLWYYLNTVQEESFLSPHNPFFQELAEGIMEILEPEYEYAPENELLKKQYVLQRNEKDFYKVRYFIDTILFKTYLFFPDTGLRLLRQENEILEERDEHAVMYLREMRDDLIHSASTSLLSLKGSEWAAEILGKDHPLAQDVRDLSPRVSGFFLYKDLDETNVCLEHIASSRKFLLLKSSFDYHRELSDPDTVVYLGMVRWKGQWWFSGISFQKEFNAELILDEKNSVRSRMQVNFLEGDQNLIAEVLHKQKKAFLDMNRGSPIAFMLPQEVNSFIHKYQTQYNKSLAHSASEMDEAKQRARNEGFFGNENHGIENDFGEDAQVAICFFNPNSGMEVFMDVESAFPPENNPFFKAEDSKDHIMDVLINPSISKELALYCLELAKDKLPFFREGLGTLILRDSDFLLRFYKKENYHTIPQITLTGKTR